MYIPAGAIYTPRCYIYPQVLYIPPITTHLSYTPTLAVTHTMYIPPGAKYTPNHYSPLLHPHIGRHSHYVYTPRCYIYPQVLYIPPITDHLLYTPTLAVPHTMYIPPIGAIYTTLNQGTYTAYCSSQLSSRLVIINNNKNTLYTSANHYI